MAISCSVGGCKAKQGDTVRGTKLRFHRFPLNRPDVLQKWIDAIGETGRPTPYCYICSKHFSPNDYITGTAGRLKYSAVPQFELKVQNIDHDDIGTITSCAIDGCTNVKTKGSKVTFHRFPLDNPNLLEKWLAVLANPNFIPDDTSFVCDMHFLPSDFNVRKKSKVLKDDAVPVLVEKIDAIPPDKIAEQKKVVTQTKIISKRKVEEDISMEEGLVNEDDDDDDEYYNDEDEDDDDEDDDDYDDDDNDYDDEENFQVQSAEVDKETENMKMDISPKNKSNIKSNLEDLLSGKINETVTVLIVGENGEITNSQLSVFKNETENVNTNSEMLKNHFAEFSENDNESVLTESAHTTHGSESGFKNRQQPVNRNERDNKMRQKLMEARKKIKVLQVRCRRLAAREEELKVLLKLLILKRGKGEKNLDQLFEEYKNRVTSAVT